MVERKYCGTQTVNTNTHQATVEHYRHGGTLQSPWDIAGAVEYYRHGGTQTVDRDRHGGTQTVDRDRHGGTQTVDCDRHGETDSGS